MWSTASSKPWTDTRVLTRLRYDPAFGVANSGVVVPSIGARYFVAGHANGFVTVWRECGTATDWEFVASADIRAAQPVHPWGLHNIRGLDVLSAGKSGLSVVAGSEDGDLTLIDGKRVAEVAASRRLSSSAV